MVFLLCPITRQINVLHESRMKWTWHHSKLAVEEVSFFGGLRVVLLQLLSVHDSRSRRDVMRLSNKRSPYLFGVATANRTKVTTPNKYGAEIIARMSDWENGALGVTNLGVMLLCQGWEFEFRESTHRLHLYPLGGVFYSPWHRAPGRRDLDFTSLPKWAWPRNQQDGTPAGHPRVRCVYIRFNTSAWFSRNVMAHSHTNLQYITYFCIGRFAGWLATFVTDEKRHLEHSKWLIYISVSSTEVHQPEVSLKLMNTRIFKTCCSPSAWRNLMENSLN